MATYRVKEFVDVFTTPVLRGGFTSRWAAEAWLVDHCAERHLTIIRTLIDDENDAIDLMTDALRQFAVELEQSSRSP